MNQGGDADNWPEIEALLKAAIELPSAEQADYLRRNCKDTAQRERVQALLAAVRMDTGLVLGSPGSGGQSEAKEWLFCRGGRGRAVHADRTAGPWWYGRGLASAFDGWRHPA